MVNQKRVISMVNRKGNRITNVRKKNGYYYATDEHIILKIPADMCDLSALEGYNVPALESLENVIGGAGGVHLAMVTKKELNEHIRAYGKDTPYNLGYGYYVNPSYLKQVLLICEVDEAVVTIGNNPLKPIAFSIGEVQGCIAPMRVTNDIVGNMKKYIQEKDFERIEELLSVNDNKQSIKAFSHLTGCQLSKNKGERMGQVAAYFGEAWRAWKEALENARKEKERKQQERAQAIKQEKTREALEDYRAGKWISGELFLLLCDEYGVKMHIRTRGFCKNNLLDMNKNRYRRRKNSISNGFFDAWNELNKILEVA